MKSNVDVDEVEKLLVAGAQIVEVLPRSEYDEEHLPGAVSIPLAELPSRADELDRDRPVVVYCYDTECDLSPRAAAWLVHLGFAEVYDFVAGKVAWFSAGLPSEGSRLDRDRAGSLAREATTCDMDDDMATIAERVEANGLCVVVDGNQVVLGAVRRDGRTLPPDAVVADVMDAAPRTVRPSLAREKLAELFEDGSADHVIVATAAGELLGVVHADDVSNG